MTFQIQLNVSEALKELHFSSVKEMKPEFRLNLNINGAEEWHSNTPWHSLSYPVPSALDKNKEKKASETEPPYYNPNLPMKAETFWPASARFFHFP